MQKRKVTLYWEASNEGSDFLSLGEPIKVGHHSKKGTGIDRTQS